MPVTPDAVSHLQAAGHDAIHVSSVGLAQATDPEIIEMARRDGRVVVTESVREDFARNVTTPASVGTVDQVS
jgi:predicted nuclease of predicted toxin-antitoxin system